jgi:uncharacterized surface protein with fasciclin (FAS1) repeats
MFQSIAFPRRPPALLLAGAVLVTLLAFVLTARGEAAAARPAEQTIARTAASAGQFKTLLSLAKQAGLTSALSGPGPLTVFAPTDAAFRAVPKATLAKLRNDPAELRRVLLYHVLKGKAPASRVVTLRSAKTLAGPSIRIRVRGGSVFLNGMTNVAKTDIAASNGVIHVIDGVLLPPAS